MKLSGLVPMQALGMASRSHKLVKEAEEMCPKCGKPMAQCECMGWAYTGIIEFSRVWTLRKIL